MPPIHTSAAAHATGWRTSANIRAITTQLQRLLRQRTGNTEDARDLVQDAWLRLLEQGEHAHPREAAAWLHTVAHNLCIDHLRQRQTSIRHNLQPNACAPIPERTHPDAAESLMYRQALDVVQAALQALPERAREAFLAHRLYGTPQAELAARHGVSLATIERDVQCATDRLHAALLHWRGERADNASATKAGSAHGRRRNLAALLGIAGLGASGLISWQLWQRNAAQPTWQLTLSTRRGQLLTQPLPDGSTLSLDAHTHAHLAYSRRKRHVQLLQGAVFASVGHDSVRPFVLEARLPVPAGQTQAPSARITVLGTRFSADLTPSGLSVRVAQGTVSVAWLSAQGVVQNQQALHAGQGLHLSANSPAPTPLPAATAGQNPDTHAAPWQQGQLRFDAEPLAHAIQRLARYQPEDSPAIVLDPRVQHLAVSGQMPLRDAQDWLESLPTILPVRIQRQGHALHIGPRHKADGRAPTVGT